MVLPCAGCDLIFVIDIAFVHYFDFVFSCPMWGKGAAPTIATFIITDEIAVLVVDKNVEVGVTVA